MEPLAVPKTIKIYQLVKQNGMSFSLVGFSGSPNSIGTGFFLSQTEAEHHRTLEALKDSGSAFHIYELTVPNPIYKE